MSLLLLLGALPMQVMAAELKEASEDTVTMSNKYIKVIVNKKNGRFAIRTADGQPLRKNDQNTTLTFDEDDTSFTTFRIKSGDYKGEYIFGNGYDPDANDTVYVTVIAADFDDAHAMGDAAKKAAFSANYKPTEADAKADAEARHRAGVKAADNPDYYDDIFNIFKN